MNETDEMLTLVVGSVVDLAAVIVAVDSGVGLEVDWAAAKVVDCLQHC